MNTSDSPASAIDPAAAAGPLERPLLPFLPLIYVAWADGDLSPSEIQEIRARMRQALPPSCHGSLDEWLDPEAPPPARKLRALLALVRRTAAQMAPGERRSLAQLGLDLARVSGESASDDSTTATYAALQEVEAALGLFGPESSSDLLGPRPPAEPAAAASGPASKAAATFDVAALRKILDGNKAALRHRVLEVLRDPEFRYQYELDRPSQRAQTLNWCQRLADEGLGSLAYPRSCGGQEDVEGSIAVFETLALHDASMVIKFGVQFGLFGGSILNLGTEKHHAKYLAQVGSLDLPGCFAMSETGHGSNVRDLETTARYDPATDELVIHTPTPQARKDWIGNAALHGRMATVFAQLEVAGENYGVHAILVPVRDEAGEPMAGVRIEDCGHKVGLNGIDNGRFYFDQVRVPRENLLNRFGEITDDGGYSSPIASDSKRFFTMLGTLVAGRVSVAAASLSAAKSAMTIAVRYAEERRQFGPAEGREVRILDYRTHQHRLLPRLAALYAYGYAQRHLVDLYAHRSDETARQIEGLAAGLKAMASWFSMDTLQTCREACGGKGYLAENRFGRLRADTDIFTTFEGDNIVLLQLVARNLLTAYRRQFGEMGFGSILRYVTHQATVALAELNPVVTRNTDPDHLRDGEFQLAALRYREEHLLSTVAKRIKQRLESKIDPFLAFNQVQNHLVSLAKGYVERVVLEQFIAGIAECEDEELRRVLSTLRSLYALWRIDDDSGWFLGQGYLEPSKAKAIRKQISELCGEVRGHALSLVDAFGIPDEVLAAPIGTGVYL